MSLPRNPVVSFLPLLAAIVPVASPAAQSATASREQPRQLSLDATAPSSRACSIAVREGTLRADAATYVATFDEGGTTFTPALGRRAPRRQQLRLATVSIARTGGPAAAAVTPLRAAPELVDVATVRHDRGVGVSELWHVTDCGVELAYVLSRPLPGDGDLVVRLRVETDLAFAGDAADGGLRFASGPGAGAGAGGVRIGVVTGIDADGLRQRGELRFAAGELELRLPAAFVRRAAYPLTLDPLIGTELPVGSGGDDAFADVAFDEASARYLVVWQRDFAIDDSEVMGRFHEVNGKAIGGAFVIRGATGTSCVRPSVGSVRMRSRFLVAWREASGLLGPWQLACCGVNPDGAITHPAVVDAISVSAQDARPIVGGNGTTGDGTALIAYAQAADIRTVRVLVPSGTAQPTPQMPKVLSVSFGSSDGVAVTRSCGTAGRWVVSWHANDTVQHRVLLRAVNLLGNAIGSALEVAQVGSPTAIDGEGDDYMVAWVEAGDVRCQSVRWNGSDLALQGSARQLTTDADVEREPAIACLGPKYLVAWAEDGGLPLQSQIQGVALEPGTCKPCEQQFTLTRPKRYDCQPAIGAQRASQPGAEGAFLVFTSVPLAPPFAGEIVLQRFAAFGPNGKLTSLGGGCGASYVATATGPIATGNKALALLLDGVQGASAAYVSLGAAGAPPLSCGACSVMPPLVTVPVPLQANRATLPFHIACNTSLVGNPFDVQWWILNAAVSPCSLVPGLSFSPRYRVTIGE